MGDSSLAGKDSASLAWLDVCCAEGNGLSHLELVLCTKEVLCLLASELLSP